MLALLRGLERLTLYKNNGNLGSWLAGKSRVKSNTRAEKYKWKRFKSLPSFWEMSKGREQSWRAVKLLKILFRYLFHAQSFSYSRCCCSHPVCEMCYGSFRKLSHQLLRPKSDSLRQCSEEAQAGSVERMSAQPAGHQLCAWRLTLNIRTRWTFSCRQPQPTADGICLRDPTDSSPPKSSKGTDPREVIWKMVWSHAVLWWFVM